MIGSAEQVRPWPDDGIEHAVNCPLCSSPDRQLLHAALEDRIFFAAPGAWDMWRCMACGTGWLDPRPNEATIGLAYSNYYTHAVADPPPPTTMLSIIRAKLGNGYRNSRYGTDLAPASALGRWAAALLPPLKWQIDVFYRYLPKPGARTLRILDVGCGNGSFLQAARHAGWLTCGVEPDTLARQQAEKSGHEVRPHISDWRDQGASFDAVTISHVIEHVHDPSGLLSDAIALLRPGGHLFLDTPNLDAVGHRLYGRHWRGLESPRHLMLFNRAGLHRLIREAGFSKLKFRPRIEALPFTARQSRMIAAGIDPYSNASAPSAQPRPTILEYVRAMSGPRSEFLTVTAEKPR